MVPVTYRLDNGIRCLIYNKKCFNIASILILVKSGSINEPPSFQGMSHFLEHMFFKGTHKRLTQIEISNIIDKYGGVLNAYTDKEHTGYYIRINNKHFNEAFDVMSDMITNSIFMPKDLTLEKKVVLNEMQQRLSNPRYQNNVNFYETIFKGHKLEHRVIGQVKDINKFDRISLLAYLFHLYKPENIVISVSGHLDTSYTKKLIQNTFGKYKSNIYNLNIVDKTNPNVVVFNKHVKVLEKYNDKKDAVLKWNTSFKLEINPKIQHIFVLIGFPGYTYHNKNKYVINFISSYLSKGMSSVLFQKVRSDKGLVYGISSFHKTFDDTGVFGFKFSVKDIKRFVETLYIVLSECQKLTQYKLKDDVVNKLRTSLISKFSFIKDSSYSMAEFLGVQYLNHPRSVRTPEEIIEIYKDINANDIRRIAKEIFDFKKIQTSVISHTKFDYKIVDKVIKEVKMKGNKKKTKKSNKR